jgi:predicted DNA-binding protein (MmcQ/YjbR family)
MHWEKKKKCDPERAQELRAQYEGIMPGFHSSKKALNTVSINQDIQMNLLKS